MSRPTCATCGSWKRQEWNAGNLILRCPNNCPEPVTFTSNHTGTAGYEPAWIAKEGKQDG